MLILVLGVQSLDIRSLGVQSMNLLVEICHLELNLCTINLLWYSKLIFWALHKNTIFSISRYLLFCRDSCGFWERRCSSSCYLLCLYILRWMHVNVFVQVLDRTLEYAPRLAMVRRPVVINQHPMHIPVRKWQDSIFSWMRIQRRDQ